MNIEAPLESVRDPNENLSPIAKPTVHPLIRGLFGMIPNPGALRRKGPKVTWSKQDRESWFQLAICIFNLIYPVDKTEDENKINMGTPVDPHEDDCQSRS